jgi:hypothetical protein
MGLFGWGKPKRFVQERAAQRNLISQLSMTPKTLTALRRLGVESTSLLRLEFFFYTNSDDKARALATMLETRGYSVERRSAADEKLTLVTGWTCPVVMADGRVLEWTRDMVALGVENDCVFDGWGTSPGAQGIHAGSP